VWKDADVKGRGKSESRWQNNILSFDTIPDDDSGLDE
jgi:hypothetical protein